MGLEQAVKVLAFAAAACDVAPPPSRRQLKLAAPSALKKNSAAGVPVMAGGPAKIIAWGPCTFTWTCAVAEGGSGGLGLNHQPCCCRRGDCLEVLHACLDLHACGIQVRAQGLGSHVAA